jgi:transposase-like protein
MGQNLLSQRHLTNDLAAHEHLVKLRWPNGIQCPHCQANKVYKLNVRSAKRIIFKCAKCRKQFSATVGTIFEDSHIPLAKWFMAMHLMCSSKKGMSAHQMHRMLGVTYKTAWFMAHRIRHAMTKYGIGLAPMSGIVECDETYIGGKTKGRGAGFIENKIPVFSLVQRGGEVRSFVMPFVTVNNLRAAVLNNVDRRAQIMTDSFMGYKTIGQHFSSHESVNHSIGEYARGNAHTNTVEGYFSLLKRGIVGTYHHVGEKHLHRYLAEFDFRYNARKDSDSVRTHAAMRGIVGKRLLYQ